MCLCPNAVNTGLLGRDEADESTRVVDPGLRAALGDVIEPEVCAEQTLEALDEGRFLVLPHERVGVSFRRKGEDYDAWLVHTNERLRRMRG